MDIQINFIGQGHMSKVRVTSSRNILTFQCNDIIDGDPKEANAEYNCRDTTQGVFKGNAISSPVHWSQDLHLILFSDANDHLISEHILML